MGVMEGAKPPPRSAIEPLHRARQALADRDLDRLCRTREGRLGGRPLVGGGGRQDVLDEIGDLGFGNAGVRRFQSELRARALRKPRRHLKARVMTRRRVTLAGVAEPHDDAVHARRRGSTSTEQLRESRHRASKTPKRPVHSDGATDAYFRSTIASASVRVERSVIGSTTRIASSAPAASSARRCEASFSTLTGGTSCGRSLAPSSAVTRTHALYLTSPGCRPARRQAASISRRRDAKPSGLLPYQLYQVFHASTCGRAVR